MLDTEEGISKFGMHQWSYSNLVHCLLLYVEMLRNGFILHMWQPHEKLQVCSWSNALLRAGMSAGDEAAEWDIRVLEAQQAVTMQASAMASAYGSLLNVTTDDILWGMGQVIKRPTLTCFGDGV